MHLFGHVTSEGTLDLIELLESILGDNTLSVIQIIIVATVYFPLLLFMRSVSSLTHWV